MKLTEVRARKWLPKVIHGPAHIVFEAWTKPELLKRWWAAEVVWNIFHFVRGRCSYGGHVPFRVQPRCL